MFSQYGEAGAIIVNDREMLTEPDWEARVNGGEEGPFVWQPGLAHKTYDNFGKHYKPYKSKMISYILMRISPEIETELKNRIGVLQALARGDFLTLWRELQAIMVGQGDATIYQQIARLLNLRQDNVGSLQKFHRLFNELTQNLVNAERDPALLLEKIFRAVYITGIQKDLYTSIMSRVLGATTA